MLVNGNNENMLVSYLRATGFEWGGAGRDLEPGHPYGAVVAVLAANGHEFYLGWSVCSKKDQFSKEMAKKIALNRARYFRHSGWAFGDKTPLMHAVPEEDYRRVKNALEVMWDRATKYYKQLDGNGAG